MANIATVFVRVVLARGRPRLNHSRMLSALTRDYRGNTYCVPIWLGYTEEGRCIDIQYGAKWHPGTGPERLWRRLSGDAEYVWVRCFDDGGDHDTILAYDAVGSTQARVCWYRFDEVALFSAETRAAPERIMASGAYLSGNDRSLLGTRGPTMLSPTTAVLRYAREDAIIPPELHALLVEKRDPGVSHVDYSFRGRIVRREERTARGWSCYCLDGWDNCCDTDYLISRGEDPVPLGQSAELP